MLDWTRTPTRVIMPMIWWAELKPLDWWLLVVDMSMFKCTYSVV